MTRRKRPLAIIKPQPDYTIDWNGGNPVIRNADGEIIAEDLYISDEAHERLVAEFKKKLGRLS